MMVISETLCLAGLHLVGIKKKPVKLGYHLLPIVPTQMLMPPFAFEKMFLQNKYVQYS